MVEGPHRTPPGRTEGALIRFHDEARLEAVEAAIRYARISPTLADGFNEELERGLAMIEEGPERWPKGRWETRRYKLNRFPFALIYLTGDEEILIVAVAHGKRKPGYWKDRLGGKTCA